MTTQDEIAKWREAHQNPKGQNIPFPEAALATVAPFPSLYATDFIVFLEARGIDPQVASFVRGIAREMDWTYDNWAKAHNASNPGALIDDMLNNCNAGGAEAAPFYAPIRKFLADYAQANGYILRTDQKAPNWMAALEQPIADLGQRPPMDGEVWQTGVTAPPPPMEEKKANGSVAPRL